MSEPKLRKDNCVDGRSVRDKNTYYFKDITGLKFGKLTVLSKEGHTKNRNITWLCQCDCGRQKVYPSGKLLSGRATNCGCEALNIKRKVASKHGLLAGTTPRTFICWNGMKARCLNPNCLQYKDYGGRGIKICDEWLSFENFHNWAINNGYSDDLTIERIDVNGNYTPDNCKWIPRKEQAKNTRRNHYVTIDGTTKIVSDWIRDLKIDKSKAYKILRSGEEAFIEYCRHHPNYLGQSAAT